MATRASSWPWANPIWKPAVLRLLKNSSTRPCWPGPYMAATIVLTKLPKVANMGGSILVTYS